MDFFFFNLPFDDKHNLTLKGWSDVDTVKGVWIETFGFFLSFFLFLFLGVFFFFLFFLSFFLSPFFSFLIFLFFFIFWREEFSRAQGQGKGRMGKGEARGGRGYRFSDVFGN